MVTLIKSERTVSRQLGYLLDELEARRPNPVGQSGGVASRWEEEIGDTSEAGVPRATEERIVRGELEEKYKQDEAGEWEDVRPSSLGASKQQEYKEIEEAAQALMAVSRGCS